MNRCDICGKWFDRGTTTLPNNVCDNCMKYVQYKVVKRTTAEDVRHYMGLINSYEKEIEKCKNTINQNEELIEWARQQINIL